MKVQRENIRESACSLGLGRAFLNWNKHRIRKGNGEKSHKY